MEKKKCRSCAVLIAKSAATCPHCGSRFTHWSTKVILVLIILLGVAAVVGEVIRSRVGG